MKIAKSLILSTLALGMTVGAYATFAAPEQESKTIAVSSAGGTVTSDAYDEYWTWESHESAESTPVLTVTGYRVVMSDLSDRYSTTAKGRTLNFTVPEGWYVSAIEVNPYGSDDSGEIKIGEKSFYTTTGSDIVSATFTQDEVASLTFVSMPTFSGIELKNFNVTVSKVQEVVEPDPKPVVTVPAEGKYYRLLTRFNGDQNQARYGSCIELLRDAAGKGNNAQADRLWSNAPAEEGADNYDYQWFTFEADPAGSGYYALVCKAKPNGSVNSVPSVSTNSNTARWDYDNDAKHYGFYLVSEASTSNGTKITQGTDEAGFYSSITSKDAASGWYMNISAAGQGFSVHLYSDPTDQNAGLFTFEPMPETEIVDPVDPDTKSFNVLCELGTFARYDGNTTSSSVASWTSNATEPQLLIKAVYVNKTDYINNMTKADEGDIVYYSVNNVSKDPSKLVFELDDEAWYVSGFSFKAISSTSGINITVGEDVYNPTAEGVLVSGTFTQEGPAEVQFSGEFGPTTLSEFVVNIAKVDEGGDPIVPEPKPEIVVELDRSLWSADASSQTEDGSLTQYGPQVAFDDNVNTFWGNSWQSAPGFEERFQVYHLDLGAAESVDSLSYINRQSGGSWDVLHEYEIYVTDEAVERVKQDDLPYYLYDFTGLTPVATGALEIKSGEQAITFEQASGRHVYIKALSAYGSATATSTVFTIAELKAFKHIEVSPEDLVEWEAEVPEAVFNTEGKWSINSFCCEENGGEGAGNGVMSALIDDNIETYCHSGWYNGEYKGNHAFVLDLGEATETLGLAWVPRQKAGADNGRWTGYNIWFFDTEDELPASIFSDVHTSVESFVSENTPDVTGTLSAVAGDPVEISLFEAPVTARYMLVNPIGNGGWNCAAEVGLVKNVTKSFSVTRDEYLKPYLSDLTAYGKLLPGADELAEAMKESLEEAETETLLEVAPAVIEAMKEGLGTILESLIDDGSYLTITNVRRGQYLASKAVEATETAEAFTSANTLAAPEPDAVWTLVRKSTSTETEAADEATDDVDNTFVLRNEKLGEAGYLCFNSTISSEFMCMGEYSAAYHFTAEFTPAGIAFMFGNDNLALNMNSTDGNLTWYYSTDAGSKWTIGLLPAYEGDTEAAAITWPGAPYLEDWKMGYTYDALTTLNITLPEGVKPSGLGTGDVYYYYYNASDELVDGYAAKGITASDLVYNEETKTWSYTLPEVSTKSAYFYAEFDANFFYATAENGAVSYLPMLESYEVQVNYSPATELALIVTPAEGEVTEISEIRMSIEDSYFDVNFFATEAITLSKDNEEVATLLPANLVPAEDYSYYSWTLTEACTAPGTYTLTVPAQTIMGSTGRSAATTVTWTIKEPQSGITDVTVNGKAAKVYDLQGRRVVRPVRGSVNIVDGKKTIVRK